MSFTYTRTKPEVTVAGTPAAIAQIRPHTNPEQVACIEINNIDLELTGIIETAKRLLVLDPAGSATGAQPQTHPQVFAALATAQILGASPSETLIFSVDAAGIAGAVAQIDRWLSAN